MNILIINEYLCTWLLYSICGSKSTRSSCSATGETSHIKWAGTASQLCGNRHPVRRKRIRRSTGNGRLTRALIPIQYMAKEIETMHKIKGFPTRPDDLIRRFCCSGLREHAGKSAWYSYNRHVHNVLFVFIPPVYPASSACPSSFSSSMLCADIGLLF